MSKWEQMARKDFNESDLAVFFERSGKYQYDAGMDREIADRRAYLEMQGVRV